MSDDKSDKNEKLKKESKINTGISNIKITIYSNLGKVDLNPKMFHFPEQSALIKNLNDHPFLSININYNISKLDRMTHQECINTFFNKRVFINFLKMGIEPTKDETENEIIIRNIQIMLDYIFPMSFPVIRVVKQKSKDSELGFVKAFKKEFFKRKYNTILTINGKKCTVDGTTMLDTFTTNPIYIKLWDSIESYKRLILSAIKVEFNKMVELFDKIDDEIKLKEKELKEKELKDKKSELTDLNILNELKNDLNELKPELANSNFDSIYSKIKGELNKIKNKIDKVENYSRNSLITSIRSQFGTCLTLMTINYIGNYNQINKKYGVDLIGMNRKYAWHRKIIDDVQEYCFPKRESLNEAVKTAIESTAEFNLDEIQKLRDGGKNTLVDIDKIDLNIEKPGAPRYNIVVQLSLFGGIITDKNKKYIKCKYEEQKLGADINKQITESEQGDFFDLSDEIAKIDKKLAEANKKIKKTAKDKKPEYNDKNFDKKPDKNFDMPAAAAQIQTNSKKLSNNAKQYIEDNIQSAIKELPSRSYLDSLYNNEDIISYIENNSKFLDYANYAYTNDNTILSDPNYKTNKKQKQLLVIGEIDTKISVLREQLQNLEKNPQDDQLKKNKMEKEKSLLEIIQTIFKYSDDGTTPVKRRSGGKKTQRKRSFLRKTRKH
jgi:hypothetical protein